MSKFKVGDVIKCINGDGWEEFKTGEELTVTESDESSFTVKGKKIYICQNDFVLAEDRSTWHPHHDVIVAWAKGAKVQYKEYKSAYEPDSWKWVDHLGISAPAWYSNIEYRVKPEPDNTAEIADIERKMRELSEAQKELADRLEKLK